MRRAVLELARHVEGAAAKTAEEVQAQEYRGEPFLLKSPRSSLQVRGRQTGLGYTRSAVGRCGAADSDFDRNYFASVQTTLIGAVQLYLTDKDKCSALAD